MKKIEEYSNVKEETTWNWKWGRKRIEYKYAEEAYLIKRQKIVEELGIKYRRISKRKKRKTKNKNK